jgi:hypothetical protein
MKMYALTLALAIATLPFAVSAKPGAWCLRDIGNGDPWSDTRIILQPSADLLTFEGFGHSVPYRRLEGVFLNRYGQQSPLTGGAVLGQSQFGFGLAWKVFVVGAAVQEWHGPPENRRDDSMHVGYRLMEIPVSRLDFAEWGDESQGFPLWAWNARRPPPGRDLVPYWGDDRKDGIIWRVHCDDPAHDLAL